MPQQSKRNLLPAILISLSIGALIMFLINRYLLDQDKYFYSPNKDRQSKFRKILSVDGGRATETETQSFTTGYYDYIKRLDPSKPYTAGTWYTMGELLDFFEIIKTDSDLDEDEIRIYITPLLYPEGTSNRYNNNTDVSNRLSSALVFFKKPFDLNAGQREMRIIDNPNCLGTYNWGSLEP